MGIGEFMFVIAVAVILFYLIKRINWRNIITNIVAGLITLIILNQLGIAEIPITIWTILFIGITGLVGLILIILYHLLVGG